jgi:Spy/CpxP family protein refolding chaperone
MKSMRRTAWLAVVVAATMAAAAWAQQAPPAGTMKHPMPQGQMRHGGQQGMGMVHGQMGVFTKLNLTPEQAEQVHKLMADAQAQQQPDMEQMHRLHEQLRDQVFAEAGPGGGAGATAQEINALQGKMMQAHVAMAEKVSAILTPDQRKRIREMPMEEMMGMAGPMGHGAPKPMKKPAPKK